MKILITGLGITGKSTFREYLAALLGGLKLEVFNLDLDYDRDKLPNTYFDVAVYIFEDVHGPTDNAVIPIQEYDVILYLRPSWWTHLQFWFSRMMIWWQKGEFAWDADKGEKGEWAGTGIPYDPANIRPIFDEFWRHFKKRASTIQEDLKIIKTTGIPVVIITPIKKGNKILFQFK